MLRFTPNLNEKNVFDFFVKPRIVVIILNLQGFEDFYSQFGTVLSFQQILVTVRLLFAKFTFL
jgi:hypothetical protein